MKYPSNNTIGLWFLFFAIATIVIITMLARRSVRETRSRYTPYTILCDTNGNYCVTDKHGKVDGNSRHHQDSYASAANYLKWRKEYDAKIESGEQMMAHILEAYKAEAFKHRQWKTCESTNAIDEN